MLVPLPALATVLAAVTTAATVAAAPVAIPDPAAWGNRRLAAQLTVSCVDLGRAGLERARRHAAAGIGAIVLLGSDPPARLGARLRQVSSAAPHRVRPFIASDEEGGRVQRLAEAIYPLPSAATMGRWEPARVRRAAHDYAVRMRRLGVRMNLGPVADLTYRGRYLARDGRTFSADPQRVTVRARAWRLGMADAGVVTVIKHWPGHGAARNSHTGPARVPSRRALEARDLLPFDAELADGAPVVMVGHLRSAGLTRGDTPASQSRRALSYLRRSAGPSAVIVTDSLTMAAASSALGLSPARAAVRSLRAGADWAMACDGRPLAAVTAIRRALDRGDLPRAQAVASARRILALKARYGLVRPR